ncbi:hypothetical protein CLV51_104142 [Chitinophaga niastensis]|uniref:Uncharacterized protein n=1 Tax=Chitinophaga niastensis TaxID=536980 RepID=A0A2P8HGW4_CHINA|nr:hypothetical protein CLV51_104142 [Chitinophaga niastensis]
MFLTGMKMLQFKNKLQLGYYSKYYLLLDLIVHGHRNNNMGALKIQLGLTIS